MDRATIYYGQLPNVTDLLNAQRFALIGLAKMAEATLGTPTAVDGFQVTPTTPASLNVILTPGAVYQLENLEATQWSALDSDSAHSVVKQGVSLDPQTFGITPPATVGYSQVFLVQVQYQDLDTGSTVLPYYNAANPSVPYSGPGNTGSAQNTIRKGAVLAQVKAGVSAPTGTQATPAPDAGFVGLFTITVANGATSISSGNIAQYSGAPFIPTKLPTVPADVQSGKWQYGADTSGTANAMVVVLNPVPSQLKPGMTVRVKKNAYNNTGATTLDVGLGPNPVARSNGAALSSGDIPASSVGEYVWDGAVWQMVNFQGGTGPSTVNNYTLTIPFAVDSGTTNNLVAAFNPAVTSLATGDMLKVKVANTITGSSQIVVNSMAPIALVRPDGQPTQNLDAYAGQVLILEFDGTNLQIINANRANGLIKSQRFTASGSITWDARTRRVRVRGRGPGGAGGAGWANSPQGTGGGGGGGGYFEKWYERIALSSTETFTVGAPGVGNGNTALNGGDGGDTVFKGCTAGGGKGGASHYTATQEVGGRGGAASGGDFNIPGGDGCMGNATGIAAHGGPSYGGMPSFNYSEGVGNPQVNWSPGPGTGGFGGWQSGYVGQNGGVGEIYFDEFGE